MTSLLRSAASASLQPWPPYKIPGRPTSPTCLSNIPSSTSSSTLSTPPTKKRGKIFTAFSVLTILITCLGLLGLISFTTQQRQKEISIRKILGASISEIIPLLTRNFVLLVGLSLPYRLPRRLLAFMHQWLSHFSYSTGITVIPFLLSALTVLLLTLLTVLFHTIKAAMADPAKGLRTE